MIKSASNSSLAHHRGKKRATRIHSNLNVNKKESILSQKEETQKDNQLAGSDQIAPVEERKANVDGEGVVELKKQEKVELEAEEEKKEVEEVVGKD